MLLPGLEHIEDEDILLKNLYAEDKEYLGKVRSRNIIFLLLNSSAMILLGVVSKKFINSLWDAKIPTALFLFFLVLITINAGRGYKASHRLKELEK